ncbi:nitrous oxide reductase family maturation protein NosD [Halosolutus amylolyticus]|uniref:Nitrous oxide reductase family maturation protein NosD n=1 Tax=Halosolutus amylolyticus TaxID=2932267 RepID=A0ABD5PKW0_9EURY|nr:right-handed parallel beta-helix repeat-containing protein [Halosolutus amylolyticus]
MVGAVAAVGAGTAAAESTLTVPDDYETIENAVRAVEPGGTVVVKPGTYAGEQVWIEKPVRIVGDPGSSSDVGPGSDAPVLDGEGRDDAAGFRLVDPGSDGAVVIEGFEVRGYGTSSWGTGVKADGETSSVLVSDCYLHDLTGNGVGALDGGTENMSGWEVRRNRIENVDADGVRFDNVSDSIVESNRIVAGGDSQRGIRLHARVNDPIESVQESVTIASNELVGRFEGGSIRLLSILGDVEADSASTGLRDVTIRGNEIYDCDGGRAVLIAVNPGPGGEAWVRDTTISGNEISGARAAVYAGSGVESGLSNLDVRGNDVRSNAIGVMINAADPANVDRVLIRENDVEGNEYGLAAVGEVDAGTIEARSNNVVGNEEFGALNAANGQLDAGRNYWGAPSGPERPRPGRKSDRDRGNAPDDLPNREKGRTIGDGDPVSENVAVNPWLSSRK